jgi:hypothetical protein
MHEKLWLLGGGVILGIVLTIGSLFGAVLYIDAEERKLGIY